jgi:hypothetical protein
VYSAITVLVIFAYLLFFGARTVLVVGAHWIYAGDPIVRMVPVELPDTTVSNSPGIKVAYTRYEFEVPWSDKDQETLVGTWKVIAFRSGKRLVISNLPPKAEVNSMLKDFGGVAKVIQILGNEDVESDYAFVRATLEAAPDRIALFTPRREAARTFLLLMLKTATALYGESGIFTIASGAGRGFQFGNPVTKPKEIRDDLYFDSGRIEFTLSQSHSDGSSNITQADINRVIQTVRIVPERH